MLFELLTGRRPWTGDTAAAIATARLTGAVPSPSAVHGGIPPTLEAIDRKALATNPEDRFASATDMAEALEQYLGEERGAEGVRGKAAGAAGVAGAGAAGAAAAGAAAQPVPRAPAGATPTLAAGVARPNPDARIEYPSDAYAAGAAGAAGPPRVRRTASTVTAEDPDAEDEQRRGTSPWLWASAGLAVVILALAAFAIIKLTGGPGPRRPHRSWSRASSA